METTIMENQMEKKMENEMETGINCFWVFSGLCSSWAGVCICPCGFGEFTFVFLDVQGPRFTAIPKAVFLCIL